MTRGARVPTTVAPMVEAQASGRTFGPRMEGFNTVQTGGMAARQNEALGGAAMAEFAQYQHQANELNVTDAVNKLQQQAQDLSTNPETGYMRLKGAQAVQPDEDGQTMVDSYSGKINAAVDSLGGTLTNPLQRQMFMERAAQVRSDFTGRLFGYFNQQHNNYVRDTSNAEIKLATQQAILGYNDPDTLATARAQIAHGIQMQADNSGWNQETAKAATLEALSGMHHAVIDAAINDGNVAYADRYFQANKREMLPDALIASSGLINKQTDLAAVEGAVNGASTKFVNTAAPTEFNRLATLVGATESGNRDHNTDGTLVTSPKGAEGSMQVMPATQTDPGFGAKPSDGSAADTAREGRDYLQAMLQRYGDVNKALAAYNAGPEAVDKAVKDAGKAGNWLSLLPQETQAYVEKISKQYGNGGGAAPQSQFPTEQDFIQSALDHLGPNGTPTQIAMVREAAGHQYEVLTQARNQAGEDAVQRAQQWLIQNHGDFVHMPPNLQNAVMQDRPQAWVQLKAFAHGIVAPEPITSDPAVYADLATNSVKLRNMPQSEFNGLLNTKLDKADWNRLDATRKALLSPTGKGSPQVVDEKAFGTALHEVLTSMKLTKASLDGKALGASDVQTVNTITAAVHRDLYEAQVRAGKPFDDQQVREFVARDAAQQITIQKPGSVWGTNSVKKPLVEATLNDIPAAERQQIVQALQARGMAVTPDNILYAFRARHSAE